MATERQIAANRRNARKSTGPRSRAGKSRSRTNALRHGLSSRFWMGTAAAEEVDQLASLLSGGSRHAVIRAHAYTAAEAIIDVARVRCTRVAMIEQVKVLGRLPDSGEITPRQLLSFVGKVIAGKNASLPESISLADMPESELERTAEAVRRLLPQLRLLDRYERRAAARRDNALREVQKASYVEQAMP